MSRLSLWTGFVLFSLASLALGTPAAAHGGAYLGPGTAPPAAGGGALGATGAGNAPGVVAPGALGPTGPGPITGNSPSLPDLTTFELWWRQNQAPYLALKEHVRASETWTGSDGWFLGDGKKQEAGSRRPTEDQTRQQVIPALLAVLAKETDNDLVTGALIALAKVGDDEALRLESAFLPFLKDPVQEIRETAAVSLGILASPRSIPILAHLAWNTEAGRKSVGASEVDYRTRAFAAYGLGLVGARSESEAERQMIVSILRRAYEEDDTRTRDLGVACLVSLGIVPLATIEPTAGLAAGRNVPPERSRGAQIDYVLAILRDERVEFMIRAQCPVTLARLLGDPEHGVPEPQRSVVRAEIARTLLELAESGRTRDEVVQSCVLALGQLGTNDGEDPLDSRIRRTLAFFPKTLGDAQARAFAVMAMADAGARFGPDLPNQGIDDAREFLVDQLANGKNFLQPWAGLACGVLCRNLERQGIVHPAQETLRRVLRVALEDARTPERIGAFALGAGLARSLECAPHLMKLLEKELQENTRGQVAVGLGLLGCAEAIGPLRTIVDGSKYRPELLLQASIALALLDDKDLPTHLATLLKGARSLATQAAIGTALGFIGDQRSIDPLLELLGDRLATEKARAFAAVALGNVADKESLPWNSKLGFGINYRAAPPTLSSPQTGNGILDIL